MAALFCIANSACETNPVNYGLAQWQEGNCAGALAEWLPLAKQGDPVAQNNMAVIWEGGCPPAQIPRSYVEAYRWLQLSAQSGYSLALRNLAIHEENGLDRPVDLARAGALYTLAARKGDEPARLALVRLGQPVPPADLVAATQIPEQGSWAQAIAAALLMRSTTAPVPTHRPVAVPAVSQPKTCTSKVVLNQVVTECR